MKIHSNRNFTKLEFIEFIALFPLGFHHIETREMAAKNLQNSNVLDVAIPRLPEALSCAGPNWHQFKQ